MCCPQFSCVKNGMSRSFEIHGDFTNRNHGDFTNLLMVDITDGWGYISWWFFLCFFSVFCHKLMVGVVGSHTFFALGIRRVHRTYQSNSQIWTVRRAYLEATKQRITTTTRATGMARTTTKTKASQEPKQIKQNKFHVRDQIDNAWAKLPVFTPDSIRLPQDDPNKTRSVGFLVRSLAVVIEDIPPTFGEEEAPLRLFWDAFGWKNMGNEKLAE